MNNIEYKSTTVRVIDLYRPLLWSVQVFIGNLLDIFNGVEVIGIPNNRNIFCRFNTAATFWDSWLALTRIITLIVIRSWAGIAVFRNSWLTITGFAGYDSVSLAMEFIDFNGDRHLW